VRGLVATAASAGLIALGAWGGSAAYRYAACGTGCLTRAERCCPARRILMHLSATRPLPHAPPPHTHTHTPGCRPGLARQPRTQQVAHAHAGRAAKAAGDHVGGIGDLDAQAHHADRGLCVGQQA
jgi:hypothetical protein